MARTRRARRPPHQTFQCHSWLAGWCKHYHDPGDLRTDQPAIVVAYRDGALVLALPLVVRRRFGVRMLKWTGMPVSQYGDVLAEEHPAARHLIEAAIQFAVNRTRPDLVLLRKVRSDAVIAPVIEMLGARILLEAEAPYIDLAAWSDGEGHLRTLSAKARKQRRRRRRRLEDLVAGIG
jgi:CelD/BcsL family acetyltransferase involved in cellulose biosynthesis